MGLHASHAGARCGGGGAAACLADLVQGEQLVPGGDVEAVAGLGLLQRLAEHTRFYSLQMTCINS